MALLRQSKYGYEVRLWCRLYREAEIIHFHVFNVSLSHLGEKQVLVWYWLWQAIVYCGHQWDSMTSSVYIDINGQIVQSSMEALAVNFEMMVERCCI